jgi:hypothetical protein
MGIPKAITEFAFTSALDFAAAASADRNGAVLDMDGFHGVLMCVKFGAIEASAVTSIKAQQGAAANLSDAADLAGTGITVADNDDNQIFIIDLYEPTERYVRLVVDKDAAHTSEEIAWYIQYGATHRPQTVTVADKVTYERHMSPAEGTA